MSNGISTDASNAFLAGNRLQLLHSGGEYFPALIAAIDSACHEVHLETYIFADDRTGRLVADALAGAAKRGVAARVLVDGYGARDFAAGLGASATLAGSAVGRGGSGGFWVGTGAWT